MAVWVAISISLACLCLGYFGASWAEGASKGDLEQENYHLEIEVERLKEGRP